MGWQYRVLDEDWSVPGNVVLHQSEKIAEIKGHLGLKGIQLKPAGESDFPNLEVKDEGEYWETGDYRALEDKMRMIQEKIDYLSRELSSEHFGDITGLSGDEIAARIERLVHAEDVKSRYNN